MTRVTVQDGFEQRVRARLQDGLAAIAAGGPPPWEFPSLDSFLHYTWVLAFDATLTNCGWTWLMVTPEGVLVGAKGTIRPVTGMTGYMGTWDKARGIEAGVGPLIERYIRRVPLSRLVVEAPAVRGNRTESSLIAGMIVWKHSPADCDVVSATHVSAVLLGNARCPSEDRKKLIRAAVIRVFPGAAGRDWNEHERDALATGLVSLHDRREQAA